MLSRPEERRKVYNTQPKRLISRRACLIALCLVLAFIVTPKQASAKEELLDTKLGPVKVETVAEGLERPWGFVFLPDGQMLVTEKPGRLRIVGKDGAISEPVKGVPKVIDKGQGGLLDVALDPNFAENALVYLSYSEPGKGGTGTAVARGTLGDGSLDDVEVIFRQKPKIEGGLHFGSRLAFAPDGTLFVTLGERFKFDPAQDLSTSLGKIVQIGRAHV